MANRFQRGDLVPVFWAPLGQSNQRLNITGHNFDLSSLLFDVTHTGFGGAGTARIAGKPDASGTVNADFDADSPFYLNLPNITNGAGGFVQFYLSTTQPIGFGAIIEKVHAQSAVDNKVSYTFDVKENIINGVPVYPGF